MPKKYYFLSPTFTINPASPTAPKLGSILPNLTRLTNPLNQRTLLAIPPDSTNTSSTSNFNDTISSSHGGAVGLNANALQGLAGSGEVTYGYSHERSKMYACDELSTEEFEPSKDFVNNSIAESDDVKQFLADSLPGRKRVFMITGLKIATGFRHVSSKESNHGSVLKVGIDTTALGVPGEVRPQVEIEVGGARDTDTGIAGNQIVFAYRVVKVRVKRDGTAKWKYKSGGKYDIDDEDEDGEDEDEDDETFDIDEVGEEDWLAEVPDAIKVAMHDGKSE